MGVWNDSTLSLAGARPTQDARALLAAVVESSDDAIITKTLDSTITSWNASAGRLFGYTAAEIIGQPITVLIPPDRREEERHIIENLRARNRIEHYETVRVRKDGGLIDVSLTVSPVSKSKRVRWVPINDSALQVLDGLPTKGTVGPLFVNPRTGKRYVTISKQFDRIRKAAGISGFRIDDCRHFFASALVSSGMTLFQTQQILGHSSPIVTMRYAHLSTKALQEAASAASARLTGVTVEEVKA